MNDPGDGTMPRVFGPMSPQAPQASISEDRIVARILAALGQAPAQQAPAPSATLSPEDQRLVSALAAIHPSGRDVAVIVRDEIAPKLFFIRYAYTPAAGTRQEIKALVYDNGEISYVFGGHN